MPAGQQVDKQKISPIGKNVDLSISSLSSTSNIGGALANYFNNNYFVDSGSLLRHLSPDGLTKQ